MTTVGILENVRVRETPTTQGRVLKVAAAGSTAELALTAPTYADNLVWWSLRHADGVVGWSAQSAGGTTLLFLGIAEFERSIQFTLGWEGGYVNHPDDPGGETKYGISKRSYPHLDIKNLTVEEAKAIYYRDYWLKSGAFLYPLPKCTILLDVAVLGIGRALAMREARPLEIVANQLEFYTKLEGFSSFGRGWVRRGVALLRLL